MANAANTTKYLAGGSGDNVIADGYIKAVEKVWIDSYTLAFTNTNTTIGIAVVPANKKITGIDILIETTASQTSGTISVGFSTDASVDTFLAPTNITHNLTRSSISLFGAPLVNNLNSANGIGKIGGFQFVTVGGTQTTLAVKLNNWTMTSGTLKTVVRYT